MCEPLYELNGEEATASRWTRGPWDPQAQHGAPLAAILMRAIELLDGGSGLQLARVTYELIHPAPLEPLTVSAAVVRPGRRIQLIDAALRTRAGQEVVKARALWVARWAVDGGGPAGPPPQGPEGLPTVRPFGGGPAMYVGDGVEVRMARGDFLGQGPGFAWLRLARPLVAGERPSALQRLAAAADFPNGISAELAWDRYVFINPDLTVYLEREPVGEWIGLDAHTRIVARGVGCAEAVLYDVHGRIGRALQSLYVAPRVAA